MHRWAKCKFC